jgi:hypothetical protein
MKTYHYHPEYKILTYEDEAEQSPLDPPGTWLVPAYSTLIEPPEFQEGKVSFYDENQEKWIVIDDYRGVYYNINNFQEIYNDNPLVIPENTTKEKPPEVPPGYTLKWNNKWELEKIPEPEPLTPQQKLESAGLTVEELKELLGL